MSFYQMLEMIRERPGMYLNFPSLPCLDSFLTGYFLAKSEMDIIPSAEEVEFDTFQEWIQEKFNIESTQSWAKIILFYSVSEQDALDNFFKWLEEFKSSRRNDES
ncbi:hypothetical protein [Spirulina sp. 06S082]|uniref:hypothetical protein n=1 Tax=Spirulina sp. 06S082 TaxID=3110248 RepID=UPI002B1F03C5|nr:hypothetical protein [Spirulina sp. 06S082]MEA5467554.1 hypothetical protein [Spirulina sp. 06S082]